MNISRLHVAELCFLVAAAGITAAAEIFYWSQDWIRFPLMALPWVLYPFVPIAAHWAMSRRIRQRWPTRRTALVAMIGAFAMLALVGGMYIPFFDGYMIFYLRMALSMLPVMLLGVASVTLVISWVFSPVSHASPSN